MEIFIELSMILLVATIVAAIMRLLRQPLIVSYIITGIIVSPFFLDLIHSRDIITIFSQLGVALLLFIVGLNLSPKVLKEVGKVSIIAGLGQVVFTTLVGYFISRMLGFSVTTSLYVSMALTFSSTIIILKLLTDKRDMEKLYAKISIGCLLIQDIVAIFILIVISSLSSGQNTIGLTAAIIIKGILLIGSLAAISMYALPRLSEFFAKSQEFLFIFSLGWGFGIATLFEYFGFSIEIGALLAGVALSVSPYHYEISSRMKPLRDFFIILFFILIGSQIVVSEISQYMVAVIVLSLFVLIGNPLIIMIIMGILGYNKKVGLLTGMTMAQISEFSLVLIALGVSLGHLDKSILSLVLLIGIITIAASSYFILYSERIYKALAGYLGIFEKHTLKKTTEKPVNYDIMLFGYNRIGFDFIKTFKAMEKRYIVVDYNPKTIKDLSRQGVKCMYGDADDEEFLNELNLRKAKMVVSTIPDYATNLLLLNTVQKVNKKSIMIVVAHNINDADQLYKNNATYVIMPHFLGGYHVSMMVRKHGLNIKKYLGERKAHLMHLSERKSRGHEHPIVETDYSGQI